MSEKYIIRENLIVPPPRWAVARSDKCGGAVDIGWFWCLKDAQDYERWKNSSIPKKHDRRKNRI